MANEADIGPEGSTLYFLPVETRMPLKFGPEVTTRVTVARVKLRLRDREGRRVEGWGETPLSVQWVWPSSLAYSVRQEALRAFTVRLAQAWAEHNEWGHALEIGHRFQESVLPVLLRDFNQDRPRQERVPWLAALVCCAPFDIALHDAYGKHARRPVFETYCRELLNQDLASFMKPAANAQVHFSGRFPSDYLLPRPRSVLPAWHLVGGLDPIEETDLTGDEPDDGYPVLLRDWIRTDGLTCLKVKLRGNDSAWDYRRLVQVGDLAMDERVLWLTADFNCTVREPNYVNEILDRLREDRPRIYGMLLYVEQPFPYDLEAHPVDVHSLSGRKPLYLDESAHDWKMIRLGRELGWNGVALKTCKTQTGAILSACWAIAHGMGLMVQDLTNPMLAQIPHVLLAAHVPTLMGVETNAMQFYPRASRAEAVVHPGVYRRHGGQVDLATIHGPGFGYRIDEINRELPEPAAVFGD